MSGGHVCSFCEAGVAAYQIAPDRVSLGDMFACRGCLPAAVDAAIKTGAQVFGPGEAAEVWSLGEA